jgi:FkbM family methyltransferase
MESSTRAQIPSLECSPHGSQRRRSLKKSILSLAELLARLLPSKLKRLLYRVPFLAGFLRKTLNRAAPEGVVNVIVAAGLIKGFTLNLDLQTEKDYWLGTYELDLQEALQALVKPGMTAYDVGANIGYISLMLARLVGKSGKVFAFEALPSNTSRWKVNVDLNGLSERMQLFCGAVADRTEPLSFLMHASGGMGKAAGSAGRENSYQAEIEVPGISLDEFVFGKGNPPPQIIKMDIEGGEVLALPGMVRLLKETRPNLVMELHGQESIRISWEILSELGYRMSLMKSGFPQIKSPAELDWKAYLVAQPDPQ